ncbi:MAG TPA: endonuclease/exonuclease/phosphatase family protein [Candidatus Paceibacterota bacterium]
MQTTRILTWNLGLFPWCQWGRRLGLRIGNDDVHHQFFQKAHSKFIVERITQINPDICVLQEFRTTDDRDFFIGYIKKTYPHNALVKSWGGTQNILVLSRSEISLKKLGQSEFYNVVTGGLSIVPVHLNSFYPWVRNRQVKELIKDIGAGDGIDVILGDTNIWTVTKLHLPVFWDDKMSVKLLEKNFNQVTRAFGRTSGYGLNLDKIFVNKKLSFINQACMRENAKHMDHYPVYVDILH